MIDNKTERLQLPLPHPDNYLEDDVSRLRESLTILDESVATVGDDGKIPVGQLPAVALTDTFPVSSQEEMLSLNAQPGDVAIRSDVSKSFILMAAPATVLGNWKELLNNGYLQVKDAVTHMDGELTGTAEETPVPAHSDSDLGEALNAQAQALLNRLVKIKHDLASYLGAGMSGLDTSIQYEPATVGYRLANSIDITDAPYNARPNQTDISEVLSAAMATGRPVYFPEPKNPANYYLVSGTLVNLADTILHGPRSARIVFDGVAAGGKHLHARGKYTHVFGLTLESASRGSIIRAEPIDASGIDEVKCVGTKFKGGFYSVRSGDSLEANLGFPTKKVTIIDCESEAPQGQNAGHFFAYGVDRVRYLSSSVKYGKNTSAFGAAVCKDILIDGCSEKGVEQTSSGVEAAAQIEDSEKCSGKIVNCSFEHDIWVASSSGIKVRGNNCRELRVSTGSAHSSFMMDDILFSENTAGRINIQKYGAYANSQRCSVDFIENILDPASHSNLGSPYASSYIIQGSVCNLIRLRGNKNISDASTTSIQLTRDAGLRLEVDDLCRFGSKPHNISGTAGRILSDISLEDAVPGQGTTSVADILLGFNPSFTPTATGNFANIPFTNVAKNFNLEYASEGVTPIEDCIYQISGAFTITSPSDGVRFAIQVQNETDNLTLLTLVDTKLWAGTSTVPLGMAVIKLFAGKTYRLRYVTGNSGCTISSGIANTYLAIKALI